MFNSNGHSPQSAVNDSELRFLVCLEWELLVAAVTGGLVGYGLGGSFLVLPPHEFTDIWIQSNSTLTTTRTQRLSEAALSLAINHKLLTGM
jgi:hypothetical protein